LATFESSEAALVFTAPLLELDPEIDPIYGRVDFNADGEAEVGVTVGMASAPDAMGNIGMVNGGGLFGAQIAFSGKYPAAFQASDLISASLSFRTAIGVLAVSSAGRLGARGNWFAGRDAYLGARFLMGDAYFYGWVHAVWNPATNTMTIDLAAYEDTGQAAHIVPQPALPEDFHVRVSPASTPFEGGVVAEWPVLAGKTYELQRCTRMGEWETIHTVTPRIDGEATYRDEETVGTPPRKVFYRVKQCESSLMLLALGVPRSRRKRSN
jgi:hypothetical protein